jgi:8-oxo-dGTP pyrophosphatase MutT (NUDIX family)
MAADVDSGYLVPREAASVILIRGRESTGEAEVFLLRRHAGSSFMAKAFVFPGGTKDPEDGDVRVTAARELFEEAGVLLTRGPVDRKTLSGWRGSLADGASLPDLLAREGIEIDTDALRYFGHWITPSFEKKRFSAKFFVAELPPNQTPSFDDVETVDEVWVTPGEALERAGELRLPPPQVRTLYDLREAAADGPAAVLALADQRARHPHPVVPKPIPMETAAAGFVLLLPWDPDYAAAEGDGIEMPADHPLALGPSRFVLTDNGWRNVHPGGEPSAK